MLFANGLLSAVPDGPDSVCPAKAEGEEAFDWHSAASIGRCVGGFGIHACLPYREAG
jgi:hypothetical protein